jgi:uncharacterized membrane protein YczE
VGNHPSGPGVAAGLEPPTRGSAGRVIAPVWRCTGWGLPSRRVTTPLVRSYRTFSPLPATASGRLGGVLSVALSVGFPRLGVTQHPALRCPDFPRDLAAARLPGLQAQHIAVPRSHDACVSRPHPTLRGGFGVRFATLTGGLLLYGYGELLTVRAGIGLGPWDVFHSAIADITGIPFGTVMVATSLVVLVLAAALGQRPGLGTIMNALIVGSAYDLFNRLNLAPHLDGGPGGLALDVAGVIVIGLASAIYIGAAFGAGPRDSLMLAVAHRGVRISVARTSIELTVLVIGFVLGGSVGIGTLIFAGGIGICIEAWYWVLVRCGATRPLVSPQATPAVSPAIGST